MARTRNVKPGIMVNEDLAECSAAARLLWVYLFMLADREGRLEDRPKRIKAQALPYDDVDVDALLTELAEAGFVIRYTADQNRYLQIPNFTEHQGLERTGIPASVRRAVVERDGDQCQYCGATDGPFHLDHIIPWSRGGEHLIENLVVACATCNMAKRDKTPDEWGGCD